MQAELYSQTRHYQPLCAGVKFEVKRLAIIIVQKLQQVVLQSLGGHEEHSLCNHPDS